MSNRKMSNRSFVYNSPDSIFDVMSSDFDIQHLENASVEEKRALKSFSRDFAAKYTNFCSTEVIQGTFTIYRDFLVCNKGELLNNIMFLQNLSYARFSTVVTFEGSAEFRVVLNKGQAFFELEFADIESLHWFVMDIRKICICTDFDDKYTVLKLVEEGKKSKTYFVESNTDKTQYTVKAFAKKILSSPQNHNQKRALINEIEALRALRGHGVLELYEVHETEQSICLVTEHIHEDTLHSILTDMKANFVLSRLSIQRIMFHIFEALSILSMYGIIHRNIKPSSILIEDDKTIKLINFGLVTCNSAPLTSLKPCGTPGYAAPEVFNCSKSGAFYNEKCDIFGVGCVFFEMLFGYPLFQELFSGELSFNKVAMADIKKTVSKAVSKVDRSVDSESLDLLYLLLQVNPEDRISPENAIKHPYFNAVYEQKENEETIIINSPVDISPVLHLIHHENFSEAIKLNACADSWGTYEDSENISDEEPEVDAKYESLNLDLFKKFPSREGKLLQPLCLKLFQHSQ